MDCINECFSKGALTQFQSRGLITCLPKSGKARNLLKSWRPISLLNTTHKIISHCITNRLRPILNRIISREQKGFLQGRSTADCTRLMFDIINKCESSNTNGLILLIDFEKAFDSLHGTSSMNALKNLTLAKNYAVDNHVPKKFELIYHY